MPADQMRDALAFLTVGKRKTTAELINAARAEQGLPPNPEKPPPRKRPQLVPTPANAANAIAGVANAASALAEAPPLLMQKVIAGEKWIGIPIGILDGVLCKLLPSDQVILLRLYRLTWGFKKDTCEVSHHALAKACNISKRQSFVSVERLVKVGYIKRLEVRRTDTCRYQMLLPPAIAKPLASATAAIAISADNKDKELNNNDIKRDTEDLLSADEIRALLEGEGK